MEQEDGCFGKRSCLKDVLPLKTPYVAQMYLTDRCNFKCEFCDLGERNRSDKQDMSMELYKKCIDGLKAFPEKLKFIWLAGQGEPLLHKNVVEMVRYAKQLDITENISIITNASLLKREMSEKLIDAGVSVLRVSVNGLSDAEYAKRTGAKVCFEEFVDNIAYFYDQCKNRDVKIYVKILDYMVKDIQQEEKFYRIFKNISHQCAIEHLCPVDDNINYEDFAPESKFDKARMNEVLLNSKICAMPFYSLHINPRGEVLPCCAPMAPATAGNIQDQKLYEIWNGTGLNRLRIDLLGGVENSMFAICRSCKQYLYSLHKEDVLDDVANVLIASYQQEVTHGN